VPPNIALEPSALLKDERRGSARALGSTTDSVKFVPHVIHQMPLCTKSLSTRIL
jgi:hypothetical protein